MLPPKPRLPADQERLLELYRRLEPTARESLRSFAEFLVERGASADISAAEENIPVPADIPRPPQESVIAAVRRLSATFHMLDKSLLLHETSELVTAHIMQGRPAADVIDELEVVFQRHYERIESASDR
jgi:hypothetical protein